MPARRMTSRPLAAAIESERSSTADIRDRLRGIECARLIPAARWRRRLARRIGDHPDIVYQPDQARAQPRGVCVAGRGAMRAAENLPSGSALSGTARSQEGVRVDEMLPDDRLLLHGSFVSGSLPGSTRRGRFVAERPLPYARYERDDQRGGPSRLQAISRASHYRRVQMRSMRSPGGGERA